MTSIIRHIVIKAMEYSRDNHAKKTDKNNKK